MGPRQLKSRFGHHIKEIVSHGFPQAPCFPWKRNKSSSLQEQSVWWPMTNVVMYLVYPTHYLAPLCEEGADGLNWPLPVILHKYYGSFKFSGWEMLLSAEGYYVGINIETKLANKQQSFQHFCCHLFWDLHSYDIPLHVHQQSVRKRAWTFLEELKDGKLFRVLRQHSWLSRSSVCSV